jgi:hypothetical protein
VILEKEIAVMMSGHGESWISMEASLLVEEVFP